MNTRKLKLLTLKRIARRHAINGCKIKVSYNLDAGGWKLQVRQGKVGCSYVFGIIFPSESDIKFKVTFMCLNLFMEEKLR